MNARTPDTRRVAPANGGEAHPYCCGLDQEDGEEEVRVGTRAGVVVLPPAELDVVRLLGKGWK